MKQVISISEKKTETIEKEEKKTDERGKFEEKEMVKKWEGREFERTDENGQRGSSPANGNYCYLIHSFNKVIIELFTFQIFI